ncbi:Co/Zn/Cd efflux system protein [Canicola haemoglobinophilus]|uniref:Zinc transporter ZitB n=1 Tax=Canicola haemoglobinophilus TaxID=733 RepID=A0A1V4B2N5_9PAST|nr:cation diffusion facilitator family transporter [Canicola haemoglobinophilus]OOS01544.1 Co/Zn/Cd efflux system protein [Canicola haemoglobinophilus]STO54522.1 zinc transporter ZitB [Canicola haemoglobinophilus]STO60005.1 zinc transporter ZitB [Canicola haemoglobinophilus]STO67703.1 zinc transporter ZitB [Canicola haemoglobinophilus]
MSNLNLASYSNHNHDHSLPKDKKILTRSFFFILMFMFVEWFGGYYVNSLALLADAGHMANDAFSIGLSLLALLLSYKNPKFNSFFALINGISLVLIAIYIVYECVERFQNPTEIISLPMIFIATIGLIVNVIVARMILKANMNNLNIKATYFHILTDLFGSVIAISVGITNYLFNWIWIDPLASLLLSLLVFKSGIHICYEAILMLKNRR